MQNNTYTFLESRKLFLRRVAITTIGVSLAWYIGSFFDGADSLVAAIMCFITLQFSLQNSVKEGVSQLIGAGIGAVAGLMIAIVVDSRVLSAGIIIVVSMSVAKILKLGIQGSINVGITGLIILGPGDTLNTVYDRIWGTLIGVFIGILLAYWIRPDTPQDRTQMELVKVSKEISTLLTDISKFFESGISKGEAIDFLEKARDIDNKFIIIKELSSEAIGLAVWNPFFSKVKALELEQKVNALEHIAIQVRTLCRNIVEYRAERDRISELTRNELVTILNSAASAILIEDAKLASASDESTYTARIEELTKQVKESLGKIKETDDTQELLLGLGVINNMTVIEKSLQSETRTSRK